MLNKLQASQVWNSCASQKRVSVIKPMIQLYIALATYILVRLLSLELFILGVQAKKLHFCNLELILNKTGYNHIMENKKKISFFNMGTSWKKFDPPRVFQFSPEPARMFGKKIRNSYRVQFGMFWWSNHCWGSTLPKVMGKIQKALAKSS